MIDKNIKGPKSTSLYGSYFTPPDNSKLTSKEKRAFSSFGQGLENMRDKGFSRLATNLSRFDPEIRNPLLQSENFYLPQQTTRTGAPNVELNRWFSYYYKYHPLVGNLIALHSQLPLSRFGFQGIKDSSILQAYEDCADDMDMFSAMVDFLKTWFLYGETQPYLFWNADLNRFDGISFLDTSFIDVFGHTFFHNHDGNPTRLYSMIPDDLLIELLATNHPRVQELVGNNLPDSLVQAVRENKPLLLNNFNTELVVRSASPWDVRGTSVVLGCLKELMYEDKLREAQYAIAEGHVAPKWIWKLGHPGEYMPTDTDITEFRDTLIAANNDPMFNLVTHYAVDLRVEGSSGRILPIVPEIKFVEERIMSALFSNKALVTGSGVTYANSSVALRALMSRYIPIRTMAENFFMRKVFLPIALANKYYERKEADLSHNVRTSVDKLIIPKFNWSHKQNLLDDSNIKNMLIQLRAAGDLPMKTICDALDLDYGEVQTFMKQEQGTGMDPVMRAARQTAVTAATTTQTANVSTESGKHVWLELLKKLRYWILPSSQQEYSDVVKNVEDTPDASTEQQPPGGEESEGGEPAPPAPGGTGGAPGGGGEAPEDATDIPEPAGADTSLGASKKLDKDQKGNLIQGFKEALQYFDIPEQGTTASKDDKKLKLKASVEQFDFLKQASRNVLNELLFDHEEDTKKSGEIVRLACTDDKDCKWTQDYFLEQSIVDHAITGNYSALNITQDRAQVLEKIVSNMKWPSLKAYKADKQRVCPKCKKAKVKITTVSGDKKDDTQQTSSKSDKK